LTANQTYTVWLAPTEILNARVAKISMPWAFEAGGLPKTWLDQ
jgi:hypothetical protein